MKTKSGLGGNVTLKLPIWIVKECHATMAFALLALTTNSGRKRKLAQILSKLQHVSEFIDIFTLQVKEDTKRIMQRKMSDNI